ncbi:hypothetical protein [Luteipulveratus halotolerans]|uniref:Uncharacterized protein n=1 Tax=Luteipulveratus halotolerans TaxID=1631356 RepID=A0A0L6CM75_9MICO|nr:hypothetical protein [Luteipulveratus halotolerans]KNX38847.1 hypothetical protein VV01_19655 [Luteipulveratus halotolerans]
MNTFVWPTLSGVVSGVIVFFITRFATHSGPPPDRGRGNFTVVGDGNTIDASTHTSLTQQIQHVKYVQQSPSASGPSSDDETWALMILTAVGAVVAAILFLLVWPIALGALLGAAIGLLFATWSMHRITAAGIGARWTTLAASAVSALTVAAVAYLTPRTPWGSSPGEITKRVAIQYPDFGDGISGRWSVIRAHSSEVVQLLGWGDITSLAAQAVAVALCLVLLGLDLYRLLQWWSFRRVGYGMSTSPRTVVRAADVMRMSPRVLIGALFLGAIAAGLASGAPTTWMNDKAHQPIVPIDGATGP